MLASAARLGKVIHEEQTISMLVDDEIMALSEIKTILKEDLSSTHYPPLSDSSREEINDALGYAGDLLHEARYIKGRRRMNTPVTVIRIGSEFGGAAIGGLVGARVGTDVGASDGPLGMLTGAMIGIVVGAVVGSEAGSSLVTNFECNSNGISTEMDGSLAKFEDSAKSEILGIKGNISVHYNGLSVGIGGSLFEMKEERGDLALLKVAAKVDLNNRGIDVGVEGMLLLKLVRITSWS